MTKHFSKIKSPDEVKSDIWNSLKFVRKIPNSQIKSAMKKRDQLKTKLSEQILMATDRSYVPTKNKWIKCLDQIERIDKYDLREVYKICQFFRSHDFWSDNFQTLLKLRNKDKNGLKYIDRFADLFNKESKPGSFNKIKGLEFFYLDENFNLFAKTNSGLLTEFHLKQLLSQKDIIEITKYLRSGKK